jgi:hypothetical protein
MNRIVIIMLAVMMASCAGPRELAEFQRDSVIVHVRDSIRFRDSIILVPIPEGSDKAKLPDTDTSYLSTGVAESTAYVRDGQLHHSLRNRNEAVIPIEVKIPERIRSEEKGLKRYLKTVERVEVEKELSRWQHFIQSLGYAALAAGAAWLARKLSKIFGSFS